MGEARLASLVLLGSVLAVLLIACANIANLLLARAVSRTRELAMRAALGASKWRLFRQSLTENLLLGCLGGAGGCGLASVLLRVVVAAAPANLPHIEEASLNLRVLIAAALVSLGASLLFGIVPALRTPSPLLLGGWHSVGAARVGLRSILVTIQVAFSLILLSGAGLLLRSLWLLESTPLGMQPDRVITAHFVLGRQRYLTEGAQLAFFTQLEQRLAAIPGIDSAAISDSIPPAGGTRGRPLASIAVNGRPRRPEGTGGMVAWRYVTPAYFNALGIPVRRGRAFQTADRGPVAHSVLLNESLAHLLFPGEDPLGKQILQDGQGDWFNVVGIVADTKDHGPAQPSQPEYYMLRKAVPDSTFHNQEPPLGWREGFVIARTAIAPQLASVSLRSALASIDSTLPVDLQTMPQRLEQVTSPYRFNAELLSAFALIGVLLAAIGLFGVMSFLVAHRTREIGVRMALGATPARILAATLQHALSWIATGLVLGAAGSLALSRVLRSLLFQVEPNNPAILLAAGRRAFAGWLSRRRRAATRAAKVDPMPRCARHESLLSYRHGFP